jgi:hypothetical protein
VPPAETRISFAKGKLVIPDRPRGRQAPRRRRNDLMSGHAPIPGNRGFARHGGQGGKPVAVSGSIVYIRVTSRRCHTYRLCIPLRQTLIHWTKAKKIMSSCDLPRLTLRGRGVGTGSLAKPGSGPDVQPAAHDELVLAHEQLHAPQFGLKFSKAGDRLKGVHSGVFRVEMRPRSRRCATAHRSRTG